MKRKVFQLTVSAVLVASLFYYIDFISVIRNVIAADPAIYLVSILVFLTTYIPSAMRWKILVRSSGHSTNFWDSLKVIAMSYSLNKLLPWNTGDFAKSKLAERYQKVESHSRLLGVVAMERSMDASTILLLITVALPFVNNNALAEVLWIGIPFLTAILGFTALAGRSPDWFLSPLPGRAESSAKDVLEGYSSASWSDLSKCFSLSVWKWGTEVVVFWLLAFSLAADVTLSYSALVNSSISLVSALPISPAGLGPADATATGLLTLSGLNSEVALSLVVLWRSIGIGVQGAVGAVIYGLDR